MLHRRKASTRRRRATIAYHTDVFVVRDVVHRDGTRGWLLARKDGSVLDEFKTSEDGVFIAGYCENRFAGAYDSVARTSAKDALNRWHEDQAREWAKGKSPKDGMPGGNGAAVS